jgi:hypothetical protein
MCALAHVHLLCSAVSSCVMRQVSSTTCSASEALVLLGFVHACTRFHTVHVANKLCCTYAGNLWVAEFWAGRVSCFDTTTGTKLHTINIPKVINTPSIDC